MLEPRSYHLAAITSLLWGKPAKVAELKFWQIRRVKFTKESGNET